MILKRKILLVILLFSLVSNNPGTIRESYGTLDRFIPENIRITNIYSSGSQFEAVEKTVTSFLHKWSVAGASVAVTRDGKLVYARGFGYSDTTAHEQTQPYHKFRIASLSKLITAAAIMKLHEEEKLSLDDKVFGIDAILDDPFFVNPKDDRVYDITIAHLLSHEGGWSQRYGDQMFMPLVVAEKMGVPPPADTKTIIRFALDKRLHFTPGTGKAYSNLGYSILGLVVEKISGMPYEDYCRKALFEPLGIYDMELAHNLPSGKSQNEVS